MTTMNIATTIVIVVAAFSASRMQSSSISGTSSLRRCVMVAACEASRGCVFVCSSSDCYSGSYYDYDYDYYDDEFVYVYIHNIYT